MSAWYLKDRCDDSLLALGSPAASAQGGSHASESPATEVGTRSSGGSGGGPAAATGRELALREAVAAFRAVLACQPHNAVAARGLSAASAAEARVSADRGA